MVELKPITWAALIGMMVLMIAPFYFIKATPPANNKQELDPFGFDRSPTKTNKANSEGNSNKSDSE